MPRKIKPGKVAFNHDMDAELVEQFREYSKRVKDPYISVTLERAMRRELAAPIEPPPPPVYPAFPAIPKKKPGRPKKDSK